MRIALDARPLSYQLTGIGIYLKNLLDHIQRIDRQNNYYLISNGSIDYELTNPRWRKIEGRVKTKLLSSLWMQICAPVIASRLEVDLFWGTRHHLPYFLPPGIRTVLTLHDLVYRLYPETMALPNRLLERLLVGPSVRRSDCIITDTHAIAKDIQSEFDVDSKRVVPIHLGKPDFPSKANNAAGPTHNFPSKFFLCVGTLDPRKNILRILEAFKRFSPSRYGVHLVIVGSKGWKNKDLLKSLSAEPLVSHVHLTGYVPIDLLPSYYERAMCLVFPSLYEGFGLPILEAMSCGTPVVTSNMSSMKEVAGDAAFLINPFDISALVEAMKQVTEDASLRDRLRRRGLQRVKSFSWESCATKTLQVLNMFSDNRHPETFL
jgi:glycosyltransferase involved in cell wall biosynthesis